MQGVMGVPLRHARERASWENSLIDPLTISGMTAWITSREISRLYQDDGFSTPVASDTDPIGGALDATANSNDFDQDTSGNRPAYRTTAFDGKSCIEFDDTNNEHLEIAALDCGSHTVSLVLNVMRAGALESQLWHLVVLGATSVSVPGTEFVNIYSAATTGVINGNFNTANLDISSGEAFVDSPQRIVLTKNNSGGGSSKLYINNVLKASGTGTQNVGTGYASFGGWNGAMSASRSYVRDFMVIASDLSQDDATRAALDTYLQT